MTNGTPRRRSTFSGLLLVLLGILLLLHYNRGFFPNTGEMFLRWWPLLLIVWGLAKLYDHVASQRSGQTATATITGRDVGLVILLLVLVAGVGGIEWARKHGQNLEISLPWSEPYSFSEELPARSVRAESPISISTDYGEIAVHSEDTAEIRVLVKKTAKAEDENAARMLAQQASVVITETGGGYQVETRGAGGGVEVDLEVHVPKKTGGITARTLRGGVTTDGVAGNVSVESQRGNIEIRNTGGDVRAQMGHGDVHIAGVHGNAKLAGRGGQVEVADIKGEAVIEGEFYGPIRIERVAKGARFVSRRTDLTVSQLAGRIETGSGRLEISDAPGNLSLVTQKNDVVLENIGGRVHVENRHGDVQLRFSQPPREDVEITNQSGSIELVLPAKSSFEVHAESRSGDIECEFDGCSSPSEERGNARLDWKLGAKGPQLHLKTSYGPIRLRKGQ